MSGLRPIIYLTMSEVIAFNCAILARAGQPSALLRERGLLESAVQRPQLEEAQGPKRGFVLLPCRWVVEHSVAWMARFHRLARDYERLPQTVAGLTFLACICLVLHQFIHLPFSS